MKVKTFRNILIVICIANFYFWLECEDKLLPIIFNMQEPTLYRICPAFVPFFRLLAFPVVLFCFLPLFKLYRNNKMHKKTYSLFIPIFTFVLIFPFIFYPSRTEITLNDITTHNFFGETSGVYLYENAKKVNIEIFVSASRTKTVISREYINFSCEIEFEDGFEYCFSQDDGDIGWEIIEKIDKVVKENNIKKEVTGKVLYEKIFEYDNFYEYIDHKEVLYSLIME